MTVEFVLTTPEAIPGGNPNRAVQIRLLRNPPRDDLAGGAGEKLFLTADAPHKHWTGQIEIDDPVTEYVFRVTGIESVLGGFWELRLKHQSWTAPLQARVTPADEGQRRASFILSPLQGETDAKIVNGQAFVLG
jgi:hypothetical protein